MLFALLVLVMASQALAAQPLRLVTEAWPPLVHQVEGKPEGMLWEISEAVLQRMGYQTDIEFVPWKRALDLVARNRRDAVLGMGYNLKRAGMYQFPEEPLALSESVVFSSRTQPVEFEGIESLRGLNVGISAGYSYSSDVRSATHFTRLEVPTIAAGLRLLLLGRTDALIVNRQVGWYEARQMNITDQLIASDEAISGGPLYLAFAPDAPPELVKTFGTALDAFRETPEYQQIVKAYGDPLTMPESGEK